MDAAVTNYIDVIENPLRKQDILVLIKLLSDTTGEKPSMWGTSIISFGMYHYKYESEREGDAPKIGLSNRKQAIVLYGLHLSKDKNETNTLLSSLGKYKTGKGCLYITKLSDIHIPTLEKMVQETTNA